MEDYVWLHKIVTGLNPRSIWERLSTGQDIDCMSSFPEHFQKWFKSWAGKLTVEFLLISDAVDNVYVNRPGQEFIETDRMYRARFARYVQMSPIELHGPLFAMFDGKDPAPFIWKQIKPRGDDKAFRTEGE